MLYIGPDTMMPLASAFAAVVGVIVMFWQKVKLFSRTVARAFTGKPEPQPGKGASPPPGQG
jgi:hypothetical protein